MFSYHQHILWSVGVAVCVLSSSCSGISHPNTRAGIPAGGGQQPAQARVPNSVETITPVPAIPGGTGVSNPNPQTSLPHQPPSALDTATFPVQPQPDYNNPCWGTPTQGKAVVVNLAEAKTYPCQGGNPVAEVVEGFPSGVGRPETPTPAGQFHVISKNNTDTPIKLLSGAVMPPTQAFGAPELIEFFHDMNQNAMYSFHGPASGINGFVSTGCIRLSLYGINFLYNFVDVGTPVIVR